MKRKCLTIILTFLVTLGMLNIPFTSEAAYKKIDDNMYHISDARIDSPEDKSSFKVGDEIPITIYAGIVYSNVYNYIQVEILRDGKRVYFKNYNYDKTTTTYDVDTFKANVAGTYTIKAGTVWTTSGSPKEEIDQVTCTNKFTVKGPDVKAVKKIKPKIKVERTAKNKAQITCKNSNGYGMKIYRATKKTGKYKLIKTVSNSEYTDAKLKKSKVYYYKVKLFAKKGSKTYLSKFSKVVKAGKYTAPKKSETTSKNPEIDSISYDASKGVTVKFSYTGTCSYIYLVRSDKDTDGGDVVACIDGKDRQAVDKEAEKGKTYYYSIWALTESNGNVTKKDVGKNVKFTVE